MLQPSHLADAFSQYRGLLWGLCYRMSGSAADADELLQETFARALERPPRDLDRDLRPWLVRVAANLARDHLRRRKRERDGSPWLPGPVETTLDDPRFVGSESPEARYSRLESVSFAFLLALEALSPNQRAVLILRDVLDLSVRETAQALDLSEANVKTTLHRARAVLSDLDVGGMEDASGDPGKAAALQAFLMHLATHNIEALSRLLASDVVVNNDTDQEHFAARRPVVGLDKVLLFVRKTARPVTGIAFCTLNGSPAVLFEMAGGDMPRGKYAPQAARPPRRLPRRGVLWVARDARGRIREINAVVAPRKLRGLPWHRLQPPSVRVALSGVRAAFTVPDFQDWARPAVKRLLVGAAAGVRIRLRELTSAGRPWRRDA